MTRRVVTGHDAAGRAVVVIDGPAQSVRRPSGILSSLVWATDELPADVSGNDDRAARAMGISPPPNGCVFRVVEFPPAAGPDPDPGMHRTPTIDYGVVLEGEIDLVLDDSTVTLRAGDVLVQQATVHGWVNRGKAPCRVAFILIAADAAP